MSATAFQRRRREIAKQRALQVQKEAVDYNSMNKDDIKALLDVKAIEYDSRAKKEDLIKLLEGAD
jgi:hypothetical protein